MSSSSIRIYKSLQKFKLLISSQSSHIPSPPLRHPAAPRWTRSSCSRAPSQPSPPSPRSGMPPLAPWPAMDIIKENIEAPEKNPCLFGSIPNNALLPHNGHFAAHSAKTHHNWFHLRKEKSEQRSKPFCNPHLLA